MNDEIWNPQNDEPALWYRRFLIFRDLGTNRSLHAAWVKNRTSHDFPPKETDAMPETWRTAAEQWNWAARAAAWDADLYQQAIRALDESIQKIALKVPELVEELLELALQAEDRQVAVQAALGAMELLTAYYFPGTQRRWRQATLAEERLRFRQR